jgi:YHS domain-containing protein
MLPRWLGIAIVLLAPASALRAAEPGRMPWRADFSRAQAEARSRNVPMWVQFTGSWCGFCKKMDREVFVRPEIADLARDRFVPVLVQADDREDLVERFGVEGLPGTLIVAPGGRVIAKLEGYADPKAFRSFLDRSLADLARGPAGVARGPATGEDALALAGYCPVTLVQDQKLEPGRPELSVVHEGREYHFADPRGRELFEKQPGAFLPVDGGHCVVGRVDLGKAVPGQFRHGVVYRGRLYLCADGEARDRFARDPERYANADVVDRGFCPHCRGRVDGPVRGDPRFAATHDGRTYFFPDADHREAFRASPDTYLR